MFSFDTTKFFFPRPGTYTIEQRIISFASRIFFIEDDGQKFCVKMWRPLNNVLYQTNDPFKRAMYLLEGFKFNSQHAPGVYIGIAPVQSTLKDREIEDDANALELLPVITEPQEADLMNGKEYALVMTHLNDDWQLSKLLPATLASKRGMEVLARQISLMHQRLSKDPQDLARARDIGSIKKLRKKLDLNKDLFLEALAVLSLSEEERSCYWGIPDILVSAYEKYRSSFKQREKYQHIQRCHGDLKATNLWLYPKEQEMTDLLRHETSLIALDCIDFMPEFCCIDTLSDVAMLAVDIEFYTSKVPARTENGFAEKTPATYFLETYLELAQERERNVWHLLNYYMLEKAMIGTYGSILKYREIEVGRCYLSLAYKHAMNLRPLL